MKPAGREAFNNCFMRPEPKPSWVEPIHQRIMRIVAGEFEGCYPGRVTLDAIKVERERILGIIERVATERWMAHRATLKRGEKPKTDFPQEINKLLDELESGHFDRSR